MKAIIVCCRVFGRDADVVHVNMLNYLYHGPQLLPHARVLEGQDAGVQKHGHQLVLDGGVHFPEFFIALYCLLVFLQDLMFFARWYP